MLADHFIPTPNRYLSFPSPRLLDVTLRDGSFAVEFKWSESSVFCIARSLARAHVPFVELGYLGGVPELHNVHAGITADFPLSLAREIAAQFPETNFALMVHPGALQRELDYREIREAGISLLRFVFHPSWGEKLMQSIAAAQRAGLSTTINIALASRYDQACLIELCGDLAEASPTTTIYLADTCSAYFPYQVGEIMRVLTSVLPVPLGFHSHDFLSLAFANSLAAALAGATYIDVSLSGLGRGAGNLPVELWCVTAVAQEVAGCPFHLEPLLAGLDEVRAYAPARMQRADMIALVSGACNLTPPEEDLLRNTAARAGVDGALLACRYVMAHASVPHLTSEALLALLL